MDIECLMICALLGLLSAIAIGIIYQKNLYHGIFYLAISSVVAGVLFVLFDAPDLALAEIAVGSALIPFVYVIAITKQREFLVLDEVMDEGSQTIILSLQEFCKREKLKLRIQYRAEIQDYGLRDVLRKANVEMVIRESSGGYEIVCKSASALDERAMAQLKELDLKAPLTFVRVVENVKED